MPNAPAPPPVSLGNFSQIGANINIGSGMSWISQLLNSIGVTGWGSYMQGSPESRSANYAPLVPMAATPSGGGFTMGNVSAGGINTAVDVNGGGVDQVSTLPPLMGAPSDTYGLGLGGIEMDPQTQGYTPYMSPNGWANYGGPGAIDDAGNFIPNPGGTSGAGLGSPIDGTLVAVGGGGQPAGVPSSGPLTLGPNPVHLPSDPITMSGYDANGSPLGGSSGLGADNGGYDYFNPGGYFGPSDFNAGDGGGGDW